LDNFPPFSLLKKLEQQQHVTKIYNNQRISVISLDQTSIFIFIALQSSLKVLPSAVRRGANLLITASETATPKEM
jgi:hypothetical protein